jgi:hypothetical protein
MRQSPSCAPKNTCQTVGFQTKRIIYALLHVLDIRFPEVNIQNMQ